MAKQLNIDMSVRADTSQAKKALMDLQKSLQDIQNIKNMPMIADESYKSAAVAAKELEKNLSAATNVKTGKLDLNKFSMSLKSSNTSISELAIKLSGAGATGQQAFLNLAKSIALADNSALNLGNKISGLMTTLKNTAKWQISSSLLHGFMGAIQSAYGYAQDLNESLNNIRIITGQNIDQMAQFAKEANNAAKALSTTTTEYTNASLIYYQQGLSDEDVKARTDATIKMANVTRQSAEEVSSQMTAIWNNFADGAENLEYYEDVVTKLGATTASSSKEILDGLSKFAAVSETVDLSYEKASAALATVVAETRQSADTVGNAFKTLFARVEGLKLGETLEDGVDLNKYSKALDAVGVKILDANKQVKSMDDILDELGAKWDSIGKSEQIALAQTVAGVRQYTQFIALMDNYDKVQKNEDIARSSAGTIQEQADIYAEGWEAARDRVTAAAEEIYDQLLNDEAFIDILNGFEKFLGFISDVIDGLGGIQGVLLLIGSIFMQQYAKEMPRFLQTISQNLMIITGQGEKVKQNMLAEIEASLAVERSSMASFNQTNGSYEMQAKYEATQKAVKMTQELNASIKTLSETEKEEAKTKINQVIQEGEYIALLGKEIDAQNQKIKTSTAQASRSATASFQGISNKTKKELEKMGTFDFEDQSFSEAITSAIRNRDNLRKSQEELKKRNKSLGAQEGALTKKAEEIQDEEKLKTILQQRKQLEDEIKKNREQIKVQRQLEIEEETVIKGLKESQKAGQSFINGQFKDTVMNARVLLKESDNIVQRTQKWKAAQAQINDAQEKGRLTFQKSKQLTVELGNEMKKYGNYIQDTAEKMLKTENITDAEKETFNNLIANAKEFNSAIDLGDLEGAFKLLDQNGGNFFYSLSEAAGTADLKVEELTGKILEMGYTKDDVEKLIPLFQELADKTQPFNTGLDALRQKLLDLQNKTIPLSQAFSQVGSSLMQISMAINAIKNIGDIWNNEDLDTGEKILQTMTAMGTLIPTLIGLYTTFNTLKQAHIFLQIRETVVTKAKAAADFIATLAQEGLNKAMAANPAGAVVVAVMLLVSALAALVIAINSAAHAETEQQKALEKSNRELEEAKKVADEAKQAYEDLYNKVSDYKTAEEALKKCTKGTQEWKDAFQEVLNKANELIKIYPQLLDYENLFDNDGTINTEILDQAVEDFQKRSVSGQVLVAEKAKENSVRQFENNKAELSDEIVPGRDNFSNGIVDLLLSKREDINFSDSTQISKIVKDFLSEQGETTSEALDTYTTNFTEKIVELGDKFTELGNEANSVATSLANAEKIINQDFFGDEIDFSASGKNLAYTEARSQAKQEEEEKMQNLEDSLDAESFAKTIAEEYVKYDNEASSKNWKYKETKTNKNRDSVLVYIDENNEEQEKILDVVKDTIIENKLVNNKDNIAQQGEKKYENEYKNMDAAILSYLENGNLGTATGEDLVKTSSEALKKYFDEKFKDDDENNTKKKQYIADLKYGGDISQVTDSIYEAFFNDWEQGLKKVQTGIQEIPNYVTEASHGLINKVSADSISKVQDMYNKALAKGGQESADLITNILEGAGDKAGQVAEQLVNMDLSTMDTDQINTELSNLGLNFQLTAGQVAALKDVVCDSIFATEEAAQKSYETVNKVVSKIKAIGDTITDEEYKQLLEINPAMETFFTTLADGTHMLTGEVLDFKTAMQSASLAKFYQVIEQDKKDIEAYGTLSQGYTNYDQLIKDNSTYEKNTLYNYDAQSGKSIPGDSVQTKSTDTSNFWKDYEDQTRAMIQALSDSGKETEATNFLAKINTAEAKEEIKQLDQVVLDVAKAFDDAGLSTEKFAEKTAKAKEEIEETTEKIKEAQYQFEVSNAGLDYEETENYANVLMEVHEAEGLSKDAARELAIANQRLDRGLSSLNDNFEAWTKSLKNTSKDSAEYAKTISELRKSFADLLNIADANELSLDWVEKWVNDAEEMAKILDGDTEAIQRFRESAFAEMTTNVFEDVKESLVDLLDTLNNTEDPKIFEDLQKLFNQMDNGTISVQGLKQELDNLGNAEIGNGMVLSPEYTEALNTMLAQGLLTEQQLNDIFGSIGYKPKVTVENVEQWVDIPEYETTEHITETSPLPLQGPGLEGTTSYSRIIKSTTKQTGTKPMKQSVPVAQIESADKATGNIEIVNAGSANITPSYSSTTSGKSSDSGSNSSSSSTPTTKAASHSHEVNRYSNEENALKGLSDQYKRLNDAKDKAFGQGRIKMIEQEISKLRDLKKASSDYLDTIVGSGNSDKVMKALYYGEDIGKLITSGQLGGTIGADYRSLYNGADASGKNLEYTAKDSDGNEWLVSDNYSLAGFNSLFGSNLSFTFDSFGNIVGQDAIKNFLQELKNQEEDSYSSVADPDANSTTLHNKRLAYLEAIENRLDQFNDTAEKLSDQVDSRLEYISQLQEKNAELISAKLEYGNQIDESLIKTLDRSLKVLGDNIYKTPEAMNEYFANEQKRIKIANDSIARYRENLAEIEYRNSLYNQPGGQFNSEALSDSKAAELYSEIEDKIDAEIDIIQEAEEALSNYYSNLLDSLNKDISNITKKIEFNAKILEHYQKVIELTGQETDYEFLGKIIQGQIDISEQAFLANQKMTNVAEQSYNHWQQEYDKAIANNEPVEVLEDIAKHMEEAYDEMQTRQEQAMESYINYLEKANAKFQNDVNKIFADFEKKNSGIYGNFELMDKAIERQKSLSEDYLTKTNQIYETNSLLRKLNQDINKTDSITAKQKLKAFSDEISSMKEQEELSKTDLEIAKARYEVLQAEIALRDAQDAKSVVRLQRDSEGNYGYVYTADQDRIAEAEQTVEDKQNALYNLVLNYANDYSEKLFELEREHEEALKELANNTALSDEERNAERARIDEYFLNKRQALLDTHNKAMVYLDQLAAEGRAEAWSESFSQTIKDQDEYKEEFDNLMDSLEDKMNEVNELRERHAQEARVDNKSVEQSIDNITKSTQHLGDQITKKGGLADQYSILREKADNLTSTTSKMRDEFNRSISVLKNLADKAGELYRNLNSAAEAQRDYNRAVANAPSGSGTTTYSGNNGGSSDNGGSNSGSGIGGSPSPGSDDRNNNIKTVSRFEDYDDKQHKVIWSDRSISYETHIYYGTAQAICQKCGHKRFKLVSINGQEAMLYDPVAKRYLNILASSRGSYGYKTGGYTGTWNGPDLEENGKLAFLHQKELVLNADDTENVLSAVKMIRQISQTIDLQAAAQSSSFQAVAAKITGNDQTLQQEVTIHAEFPNVNDHNEIEEAFNNLINRASQYANRS